MKRTGITCTTVAISCLLLLSGCGAKKEAKNQHTEAKNIQVQKAETEQFTITRKISGVAEAYHDVILSSQANGEVQSVPVAIGDRIVQGQILARINEDIAQAQVKQAAASHSLALADFNRQQQLFDKQLISDQQFDAAKTQLQVAQSNLDLAQLQLKNTRVLSPINGIIANTYINQGEFISVGRPVARVVNIDALKVKIGVVEEDIQSVDVNDRVVVNFPSMPEKEFAGRVVKVSSATEGQSRTFPVEIRVDNPTHEIKAGMLCTVTFVKSELDNVVVVPLDAIIEEENYKGLFTVSGNVARLAHVTIAGIEKDKAAISTGVVPGAMVIVKGQKNLVNGEQIRIMGADK